MRWSERIIVVLLAAAVFVPSPASAGNELTVSAALSLKPPFEEIGKRFEEVHRVKVVFNFAASGVLQKQIEHGAPVDVFSSASPAETAALSRRGLLVDDTMRDFSGNVPVLITLTGLPVRVSGFSDLLKKDIGRIAVGNPASVPAGRYADEVLKKLGIYDAVRQKLVLCEHVRQVMDYVKRGEADAGIVFRTDALANAQQLRIAAEAPETSHSPVVYSIAAVRTTEQEAAGREFIRFVTGEEGRRILKRHGFR